MFFVYLFFGCFAQSAIVCLHCFCLVSDWYVIDGIESILAYFANDSNRELVRRLKAAGLQLYRTEEDLNGYTDKLAGQSIVISGVFTHHSRDEYKELIEKNGGKNVGSISAKTSFILAGENMGPAKLEKAKKLGITILSEDEFLKLIS